MESSLPGGRGRRRRRSHPARHAGRGRYMVYYDGWAPSLWPWRSRSSWTATLAKVGGAGGGRGRDGSAGAPPRNAAADLAAGASHQAQPVRRDRTHRRRGHEAGDVIYGDPVLYYAAKSRSLVFFSTSYAGGHGYRTCPRMSAPDSRRSWCRPPSPKRHRRRSVGHGCAARSTPRLRLVPGSLEESAHRPIGRVRPAASGAGTVDAP
jgi:hypothetical protein